MTLLVRLTALSAVVGGVFWVAACVSRSTLPRGCVGEECAYRAMRGDTPLGSLLFAVSLVVLLLAAGGVLIMIHRRSGLGRMGTAGVWCGGAGVVLFAAGAIATLVAGGDFFLMPLFVLPGLGLVVVASILVGATAVRTRLVPPWAGASLMAGAGVMLLSNEQTEAVLFAVPFGVAWILVGIAISASHRTQTPATTRVVDGGLRSDDDPTWPRAST